MRRFLQSPAWTAQAQQSFNPQWPNQGSATFVVRIHLDALVVSILSVQVRTATSPAQKMPSKCACFDPQRLAACRREQSGSHGSSKISQHIVQNTGKDTGMSQRLQISRESETGGRVVWKRSLLPATHRIRYESV